MRYAFFFLALLLLCFPLSIYPQSCPECRYIGQVFDSVTVTTEKFGAGINANGNYQELFMDVYAPYGDTATSRPVVVFAFGGGFIQGSRDEGYVQRGARYFARAGYVVAAIDYRLGFSIPGLFPNPTEELMRVFFRAVQDMRGAVQWFRGNADVGGNTYMVDPDMVMIGGGSAGAITALMVAYCDDAEEFGAIGDTSAIAALGGFYSSSGLYQGYSWEPQAILNIAGAIVKTDWMEPGDPPIISAHGDQDLVVPYQGGNIDFGFATLGLEGSYLVHQKAEAIGICSYLYTIAGGGHPSGGEGDAYFNNIFVRALPRMAAVVRGRSFCCALTADIFPFDTLYAASMPLGGPDVSLSVSNDSGGTSHRWCGAWCDPVGAAFAPDAIPYANAPGYLIGVASEGNCQASDFVPVLRVPVGQSEPAPSIGFSFSPNPAREGILLRMPPQLGKGATVQVLDLEGQVLQEDVLRFPQTWVSLTDRAPGIYILRVAHQRAVQVQKLILR